MLEGHCRRRGSWCTSSNGTNSWCGSEDMQGCSDTVICWQPCLTRPGDHLSTALPARTLCAPGMHMLVPWLPLLACSIPHILGLSSTTLRGLICSQPPAPSSTSTLCAGLHTSCNLPVLQRELPDCSVTVDQLWHGHTSKHLCHPVGCSYTFSDKVWVQPRGSLNPV